MASYSTSTSDRTSYSTSTIATVTSTSGRIDNISYNNKISCCSNITSIGTNISSNKSNGCSSESSNTN